MKTPTLGKREIGAQQPTLLFRRLPQIERFVNP
jgi:hypothetical protein